MHHRGRFGQGLAGKISDVIDERRSRALSMVIVDGRGANLSVYKRLVDEFPGSHIMCFAELSAALHECAAHAPDIIVIDDDIPDAIPMTFDPYFREHPGIHDALIVLMSSRGAPLHDQARRAGVDVFLRKPVDTKFFIAMLHQAALLGAARAVIAARLVPA